MKKKILMSGIGKRNDLVSLFLNEAKHFDISIIGADASPLPPARLVAPSFIQLPRANDRNFSKVFIDVLKNENISAHLTLVDPEIPVFGQIAKETPDILSKLLHPTKEIADLCEDKYVFSQVLQAKNIPTFFTTLTPSFNYPYIRKDRKGSAASGLKIYKERKNQDRYANQDIGNFIYQPFCDGNHYCVDAYFSLQTGELIDFCAKQVLEKSKGESFLLKAAPQADFEALLKRISLEIPLRGIINFDFLDDNGTLRLLEINCRIGGNYPASHRFGVNLIRHCLDELLTESTPSLNLSKYQKDQVIAKYFAFSTPLPLNKITNDK